MELRPLGKTGLNVSVMSQGGAAIGQQYGPVSVAEVAECVRAAIDAGVNLIDTAAYYGKGQAEEMLGEILRGGLRDKVHICTKAGPSAACAVVCCQSIHWSAIARIRASAGQSGEPLAWVAPR